MWGHTKADMGYPGQPMDIPHVMGDLHAEHCYEWVHMHNNPV